MKKINFLALAFIIAASATFTSCQKGLVTKVEKLPSEIDSVSYALGVNVGEGLKRDIKTLPGDSINIDIFLNGLIAELKDAELIIPEDSARTILQTYFMAAQQKEMESAGLKNKQEGEAYLEQNGARENVITTPSGIQYEIITEGKGEKPSVTDKVKVNYEGSTIDGTVFDSSIERGVPAEFPLNGVIPGWTEVLQLMPVGSKWRVVIPSDLAYGPAGAGQMIGPNSTLIFDIELLEIIK
jgi:FKBP-type peptidyl-prolyl cis-trans isomerase